MISKLLKILGKVYIFQQIVETILNKKFNFLEVLSELLKTRL